MLLVSFLFRFAISCFLLERVYACILSSSTLLCCVLVRQRRSEAQYGFCEVTTGYKLVFERQFFHYFFLVFLPVFEFGKSLNTHASGVERLSNSTIFLNHEKNCTLYLSDRLRDHLRHEQHFSPASSHRRRLADCCV